MFEFKYLFDIFFVIGIIFGVLYLYFRTKKWNIESKQMDRLIIILGISGILMYISANIFDSLFQVLKGNSWKDGGITFLGGAITGIVTFTILFWFLLKEKRSELKKYLNVLVIGLVIGHAFGRIGCFCAGCCFGKITDSFLGVVFPEGSSPYYYVVQEYLSEGMTLKAAKELALTTKVIPTQLIEASFLFILAFVLHKMRKNQFELYLIGYGIFRFFIEYFRADDRGKLFGFFSPSQWLSIAIVGIGIISFVFEYRKNKSLQV